MLRYLVFIFLSIFTTQVYSNFSAGDNTCFATAQSACNYLLDISKDPSDFKVTASGSTCNFYNDKNQWHRASTLATCQLKCPSPSVIIRVTFNDLEHVPLRVCSEIAPGQFCASVGNESTITGGGTYLGQVHKPSILHQSISTTPQSSCTPLFSDSPCDSKDPWGGCYVPPDDGCTRQKDGSIYCPPDAPPPQPDDTCNGATYCKAPPEGCGEGYVRGSFNGQELCVKSGPSNPPKPDNPDDPDNCANGGSYCPAPPNDEDCPSGYYPTMHNGSKICVKDNPNPNEPNPNDPNNNGGDNGGGDNGGDNGGDGDTGGSGVDLSEIINAIKALRDALLQALGSLSQKLSTLINGQKETNEHLEDIKEESVKTNVKLDKVNENITTTNSKLDTANEHLNSISDHTAAASEAIGETNKKLDGVTEAIDSIGKCKNKDYDPRNINSEKYVDCTAQELGLTDTPFHIQDQPVIEYQREEHVRFGQYCPYQRTTQNVGYFTFEKDITFICDFGHEARPYIIALGYLGALIYLLIAMRGKD
ncbi:hypothetical protein F4U02_01040 [Acinetobacter haemolyticus]|uniref:hypothetical protein n=1 Tax=Acinetobacter haemolyticus TaxID=29430 RepID=UPI0012986957|nr:hypothetical protein [Acinetobacter haemolyticus]MQZ29591.1 hypothetical protein [Acinetobacter haemolyticus]MQZ29599.1 hypothetical protein [Acinetobacter haemolyticus]